ncbi:MAG: hypothetical protein Q9174_002039 [Haloplaca sp. 1 TL-2023]
MDAHHRKIDLQSPADLAFLHTNIKSSAQQKLDLAIPPSANPIGEPDTFRPQVQQLVQDYITQTLSLALSSIAVNGLDADSSMLADADKSEMEDESNYEPYDPRMAEKLRTLYRQLEWEHTRVAELRREAPGAAARAFEERMEQERATEGITEKEVEEEMQKKTVGGLEGVELDRREDIAKMWARGMEELTDLSGITELAARMERARKAAEVVEGM